MLDDLAHIRQTMAPQRAGTPTPPSDRRVRISSGSPLLFAYAEPPIPYGHLSPLHVSAAFSFVSIAGSGALLAFISAGSLRRL